MDFAKYREEMNQTIVELSFHFHTMMKRFTDKIGITPVQYHILSKIGENQIRTVGELSGILQMDSGNMSSMCKKLEKSELLVRTRSQTDERIVELSLSDKGRKIVTKMNAVQDQKYHELLGREGDTELENFKEVLQQINVMFGKINESLTETK